jgi:uncharacterized protein (TIGR02271 family)
VVPVIEETLALRTSPVETGRIRIRKVVHECEEIVDLPLAHDEVIVEPVPLNRIVEGPASAHSSALPRPISCQCG